MKTSELRIGNRVQYMELDVIVLGIPRGDTLELGYFTDSIGFERCVREVNPIPLTEEWLLRFGFEKEDKSHPHHGPFFSVGIIDYRYAFAYAPFRSDWGFYQEYTDWVDPRDEGKKHFISCGIKYVHQLQNLWYALLGKEITLRAAALPGAVKSPKREGESGAGLVTKHGTAEPERQSLTN